MLKYNEKERANSSDLIDVIKQNETQSQFSHSKDKSNFLKNKKKQFILFSMLSLIVTLLLVAYFTINNCKFLTLSNYQLQIIL